MAKRVVVKWKDFKDKQILTEELIVDAIGFNPVAQVFIIQFDKEPDGGKHSKMIPFDAVYSIEEYEIVEKEID